MKESTVYGIWSHFFFSERGIVSDFIIRLWGEFTTFYHHSGECLLHPMVKLDCILQPAYREDLLHFIFILWGQNYWFTSPIYEEKACFISSSVYREILLHNVIRLRGNDCFVSPSVFGERLTSFHYQYMESIITFNLSSLTLVYFHFTKSGLSQKYYWTFMLL